MKLIIYILLLGSLGLSAPGHSANPSSASLQEVDATLNKVYRALKKTRTPKTQKILLKTQKKWLKQRDVVCQLEGLPDRRKAWLAALAKDTTKRQCVIKETQDRIARLRANQMTPPEVVFTHQVQDKYPPYPEVWGYEWAEKTPIAVYKMGNGEFYYRFSRKSMCCGKELNHYLVTFFRSEMRELSRTELNEFGKKYNSKRTGYRKSPKDKMVHDHFKLVFKNGSKVMKAGGGFGRCSGTIDFPYSIQLIDRKGTMIAEKTPIILYDQPKKDLFAPPCVNKSGEISSRTGDVSFTFIPIENDNFLLYESRNNFIIRFDNNLTTKHPVNTGRFFMVNTRIIQRIKKEQLIGLHADDIAYHQNVRNAVERYLIGLKGRN